MTSLEAAEVVGIADKLFFSKLLSRAVKAQTYCGSPAEVMRVATAALQQSLDRCADGQIVVH
jgi:hypothetical protein